MESKQDNTPQYGIIYNWDGAPHGYSAYPQTLEEFLEKVYAPLQDTQVGTLSWCMGLHEATWPSDRLEVVGDAVERQYGSVRSMYQAENIRGFFERGEDLYGALVQRGWDLGLKVFASIRMNDNHFWDLRPEMLGSIKREELTTLRQDHPEWLLGTEQAPDWCSTSWNIAIPQVREQIFKLITEACRQAPWDGVELDWQRHAFHLPTDYAYRWRYTLTDLLRSIRTFTEDLAAQRGRPFYLAVRVATTFESCRRIGYDVTTWVEEGLCDLVIAGGNSGTDPGAEVERFVELCKPHGVQFYGGFDTDGRQQARRLKSHAAWRLEWFRGLAQNYLQRGADGVYVFNWHGNKQTYRPLLTTMGSLASLEHLDKVYTALHRSIGPRSGPRAGAEQDDRIYGEVPVVLQPTLTGDGPVIQIEISDEINVERQLHQAELHIEMAHWAPDDKVEFSLDGQLLGTPCIRDAASADKDDPADVTENKWLCWMLKYDQVERGKHTVQACLVQRDTRMSVPLQIEHVEIYLKYHK